MRQFDWGQLAGYGLTSAMYCGLRWLYGPIAAPWPRWVDAALAVGLFALFVVAGSKRGRTR